MTLVAESEKVAEEDITQEVGRGLGKQNGIEEEMSEND